MSEYSILAGSFIRHPNPLNTKLRPHSSSPHRSLSSSYHSSYLDLSSLYTPTPRSPNYPFLPLLMVCLAIKVLSTFCLSGGASLLVPVWFLPQPRNASILPYLGAGNLCLAVYFIRLLTGTTRSPPQHHTKRIS